MTFLLDIEASDNDGSVYAFWLSYFKGKDCLGNLAPENGLVRYPHSLGDIAL